MKWLVGFFFALLTIVFSVKFIFAADIITTVEVEPSFTSLTQNTYRWYENINALNPVTPEAAENTSIDAPAQGTLLRLRMNISTAGLQLDSGATFTLQFSNSTSSGFTALTSSTDWTFGNNAGVADGATIVTTLLSDSEEGQSYNESNPTAASPNIILAGQEGEWDWVIENNSADTTLDWFFRVINSSGTVLTAYTNYPQLDGTTPGTVTPPPTVVLTGGGGPGQIQATSTLPGKPQPPCDNLPLQRVDLNGDCRVDIIDLSILLFYYDQSGPAIARYDLSDNGLVDLPDVSVLMYYWTG